MNSIMPPATDWQAHATHPAMPEQGDDEDCVDYIGRVSDWMTNTPPEAPAGFIRVPCDATPRHIPLYEVSQDALYPGHCLFCERDDIYRDNRRLRCERDHRRWKSWNFWRRLNSRLYTLGITSSGGGVSYGRCEFCSIGRQHTPPHWRGKRVYILGVKRDTWACLRRGHRRQEHVTCGLCSVCCPCPECGSTDPAHYSCEVSA